MAEHVASIGLDVIASILAEYARKIVDKAVRGERLSDWEVGFLLMEASRRTLEARMESIEKRMASLEESLKTRMEALEKRIEYVEKRIEALERRVEGLEADVKQMRASMDSLRDMIIARLVETLAKKS
jgi:chaperonin cofactor prefoldin